MENSPFRVESIAGKYESRNGKQIYRLCTHNSTANTKILLYMR